MSVFCVISFRAAAFLRRHSRLAVATALLSAGAETIRADSDYLRQVKPLLAERCYACHGALKQKAGLRLDTAESIRKGGKNGPAVVAGAPDQSLLLKRVSSHDPNEIMPPEGERLASEQVAAIRDWIARGAHGPKDEEPEKDPEAHWAFKAPVRPAIPTPADPAWARNPVDAFISAEWQKRGLRPQPPAPKSIWLRRVTLDLTGLPPTREEIAAFEADKETGAEQRVVERLLASPQHGERWGRHWMDIWRYTDWYGLGAQLRYSQKHIWRWRDWIVESLNADKPYDRMIREMLAGDELAPTDQDVLRATGFLARNYYLFNRTTWLDDTIEHSAKAFVGLTMNCAKCHDHKYDPISAEDYYAWRAIFEPHQIRLDEIPGQADLEKDGLPRAFDAHPGAPTYVHLRGDEKSPDTSRVIAPGVPAALAFREFAPRPLDLPLLAQRPGLQPFVLENHLKQAEREIAAARKALEDALKIPAEEGDEAGAAVKAARLGLVAAELRPAALKAAKAADEAASRPENTGNAEDAARSAASREAAQKLAAALHAVAVAELEVLRADAAKKKAAETKLKSAKEALEKAEKLAVSPGLVYKPIRGSSKAAEGPDETEESRLRDYPAVSTGRRTALAEWITDRRNPLTARVAVNHIWLRHFGHPLVATVSDFGRRGAQPTHPELLDWLAVEFMENGWSMKHLHRLMVTSMAYRLSSSSAGAHPETLAADPEALYYWRKPAARMESQAIRDSLLHLSGQLDPALGGPNIDPKSEDKVFRRSLYFTHSREDASRFLEAFDNANILECYRRAESVLPQQALALANSRITASAAEKLAGQIERDAPEATDAEFVRAAFETILGVPPEPQEQAACEEVLSELRTLLTGKKHPDPARRARADLVHALLNHNDFITIR